MITCNYCPESRNQKQIEQISEHEPENNWAICHRCSMDELNGVLGVWKQNEKTGKRKNDE